MVKKAIKKINKKKKELKKGLAKHSNLTLDPKTGLIIDTKTGQTLDPKTGQPVTNQLQARFGTALSSGNSALQGTSSLGYNTHSYQQQYAQVADEHRKSQQEAEDLRFKTRELQDKKRADEKYIDEAKQKLKPLEESADAYSKARKKWEARLKQLQQESGQDPLSDEFNEELANERLLKATELLNKGQKQLHASTRQIHQNIIDPLFMHPFDLRSKTEDKYMSDFTQLYPESLQDPVAQLSNRIRNTASRFKDINVAFERYKGFSFDEQFSKGRKGLNLETLKNLADEFDTFTNKAIDNHAEPLNLQFTNNPRKIDKRDVSNVDNWIGKVFPDKKTEMEQRQTLFDESPYLNTNPETYAGTSLTINQGDEPAAAEPPPEPSNNNNEASNAVPQNNEVPVNPPQEPPSPQEQPILQAPPPPTVIQEPLNNNFQVSNGIQQTNNDKLNYSFLDKLKYIAFGDGYDNIDDYMNASKPPRPPPTVDEVNNMSKPKEPGKWENFKKSVKVAGSAVAGGTAIGATKLGYELLKNPEELEKSINTATNLVGRAYNTTTNLFKNAYNKIPTVNAVVPYNGTLKPHQEYNFWDFSNDMLGAASKDNVSVTDFVPPLEKYGLYQPAKDIARTVGIGAATKSAAALAGRLGMSISSGALAPVTAGAIAADYLYRHPNEVDTFYQYLHDYLPYDLMNTLQKSRFVQVGDKLGLERRNWRYGYEKEKPPPLPGPKELPLDNTDAFFKTLRAPFEYPAKWAYEGAKNLVNGRTKPKEVWKTTKDYAKIVGHMGKEGVKYGFRGVRNFLNALGENVYNSFNPYLEPEPKSQLVRPPVPKGMTPEDFLEYLSQEAFKLSYSQKKELMDEYYRRVYNMGYEVPARINY